MSRSEQEEVDIPVESHERKIILSTNICESSLTLDDVEYVVDFCLTKFMKFNFETSFSGMSTELCSRQQAEQRAGRCGRVSPGVCFRMVSRHFYLNEMKEECLAEMQTCGLGLAFLHLKMLNVGKPSTLFDKAIKPPSDKSITSAVLSLKQCGALTLLTKEGIYEEDDGEITTIGHISRTIPCDPRQARLIAFGSLFNLANESIVMGMALCNKTLFACFTNKELENGVDAWIKKMKFGGCLQSDSLTNLAAYLRYLEYKNSDEYYAEMRKENIKGFIMKNMEDSVERVYRKLSLHFGIRTYRRLYTISEITSKPHIYFRFQLLLAAGSYPNIFFRPPRPSHHISVVRNEMHGCNHNTSFLLETFEGYTPPNDNQLEELQQQLDFSNDETPPDIIFKKDRGMIVVQYHSDSQNATQWIGNFAENVFRGMKYKGMRHQFYWTRSNLNQNGQQLKELLKGPRSPIAINFKCYYNSLFDTEVKIDRESVNLFTLEQQFPERTVSSLCSLQMTLQNTKQKRLIAKECSILPSIPGFYSFVHLLFAPKVKLRTSKTNTAVFGGCLAGLGSINGTPIFKIQDMNIDFDVLVTRDEIKAINEFRGQISLLLQPSHFGSKEIDIKFARMQLPVDIAKFMQMKRVLSKTLDWNTCPVQQRWEVNEFPEKKLSELDIFES